GQFLRHLTGSLLPLRKQPASDGFQRGVAGFDEIPENVRSPVALAVPRRQFNAGDDGDPFFPPAPDRFRKARRRVVVGDRKMGDAARPGQPDDAPDRLVVVRPGRMAMQIRDDATLPVPQTVALNFGKTGHSDSYISLI